MEEEIIKLFKYLREREENISRYSNKLRKTLVQIANLFGLDVYCRYCGKDVRVKELHEGHEPAPKIYVSTRVVDDEPFYENEYRYYFLEISFSELKIASKDILRGKFDWYFFFDEANREVLKALVKSKRLVPFLMKVAESLRDKENEYKKVSEIAEKIALVIQT